MNQSINESDFILYNGEDGKIHAQVILGDNTVFVSQNSMAEIFNSSKQNISYHIANIIKENELDERATVKEILTVQKEGTRDVERNVTFYNLDMIIAVGYRISSYQATKFRQWATRVLKEYLIKGFVLDDERLKQGNKLFGKDYFRELLERIREIRASEKMFYEKIRDFYATSVDYDKHDPKVHLFFAQAQNKLEFAVIGKTSAEIIKTRIDASQPNLGLKTFKNINRDGGILKTDILTAKNYMNVDEIKNLNLVVTMFLDYIENIIGRTNRLMKMTDWVDRLDAFLRFNEYPILDRHGRISKKSAESHAEREFDKYKKRLEISPNKDFSTSLVSVSKTGELPREGAGTKKTEPLSDFNQKLVTALNYSPKNEKILKPKKEKKPKMKECPRCGKMVPYGSQFCDGIIDLTDDWVHCNYVF